MAEVMVVADISDAETDDDFFDIEMEAEKVIQNLLPAKSAGAYENAYSKFKVWCAVKKAPAVVNENTLLVYFSSELANSKASTAWSTYSMLRGTLCIKEDVDIKQFGKLRAYLKKLNKGYHPKKSAIFAKSNIYKFVKEAPDVEYLAIKVTLRTVTLIQSLQSQTVSRVTATPSSASNGIEIKGQTNCTFNVYNITL